MFTSVISDLQRSYPRDKMDEISTSFCFICLLHLANEKGLKIETGEGEEVEGKKVGNIWDLKVRPVLSLNHSHLKTILRYIGIRMPCRPRSAVLFFHMT